MEFADPRTAESLKEAEAARARADVPYSRFRMGAAVTTATNAVVPGAFKGLR